MNPVEKDGGEELEEIEEINLGRWRIQEVKNALKMTKRGRAAGVDEVGLDLLRAEMEDIANRLTRCYIAFGSRRSGRKCGRRGLLSIYSRKGIGATVTIREE